MTLKTGVISAENSALLSQELLFKIHLNREQLFCTNITVFAVFKKNQ